MYFSKGYICILVKTNQRYMYFIDTPIFKKEDVDSNTLQEILYLNSQMSISF